MLSLYTLLHYHLIIYMTFKTVNWNSQTHIYWCDNIWSDDCLINFYTDSVLKFNSFKKNVLRRLKI